MLSCILFSPFRFGVFCLVGWLVGFVSIFEKSKQYLANYKGVSWWLRGLRTWCCRSCGVGQSCGSYSIPGPRTSICHWYGHKKTKQNKKLKKKVNIGKEFSIVQAYSKNLKGVTTATAATTIATYCYCYFYYL